VLFGYPQVIFASGGICAIFNELQDNENSMHDIEQKGVWSKIKITDRTKTPQGLPTFLAMERELRKTLTW
jgi:hypothetical protein